MTWLESLNHWLCGLAGHATHWWIAPGSRTDCRKCGASFTV